MADPNPYGSTLAYGPALTELVATEAAWRRALAAHAGAPGADGLAERLRLTADAARAAQAAAHRAFAAGVLCRRPLGAEERPLGELGGDPSGRPAASSWEGLQGALVILEESRLTGPHGRPTWESVSEAYGRAADAVSALADDLERDAEMEAFGIHDPLPGIVRRLRASRRPASSVLDVVTATPGVYAVWGTPRAWANLSLEQHGDDQPLYVGKATKLTERVYVHVHAGRTSQSQVRSSAAALLVDRLGLQARPGSLTTSNRWATFGLDEQSEANLHEWIHEHLSVGYWNFKPEDHDVGLDAYETAAIGAWGVAPPLNIANLPRDLPAPYVESLKAARARMAVAAKQWEELNPGVPL
jgi:hypothetical protein